MKLFVLTVLACFTLTLQFPASSFEDEEDEESRVFRGRFANQGEFPWMIQLSISKGNGYAGNCGGSIISKNHVITAAHCVCSDAAKKTYADVNKITGRIGHINKADGTEVKFDKMYVHQGYDLDFNADIALLKFKTPLPKFDNNVKAICLADTGRTYPNRQSVVQMGWGRFDNGSKVIISPTLKTTSLGYILDKPSCIKEMQSYAEPGQICVSNLSGEKICGGDSGGPLCLINGANKVAIGIVSFDYYDWCAEGNDSPAMYTDISYYAQWVKTTINDKDICWKK